MGRIKKQKEKIAKKSEARQADFGLILSPVITEKTSLVGGENNGVVFRVRKDATKKEIREAIERMFQVKVQAIGTCNYLGKKKRTTGASGERVRFKKAYVRLVEGQKIDIVEGV